jgi:predicted ATPase
VDINEFGAILDWPDGFFDENQREAEAILRAATTKRKKQQKER